MNAKNIFGKNLKKYRTMLGLSQEEFAEKVNVSRNTISRAESGACIPSSKNMIKITTFLNITSEELFASQKSNNKNKYIEEINTKLKTLSNKELSMINLFINSYIKANHLHIN